VDGDIFGAVTRLGRDAADAITSALRGGVWDPFLPARCLDVLHAAAGGIPSLPGVLRELEDLRSAPLLAHTQREAAIERINNIVRQATGATTLDLMLRSAVERSVLIGEYASLRVLERFCQTLLDSAVIYPRGGYLETAGHGRKEEARLLLAPIAAAAAEILAERPDAKLLRLARPHANLQPDTDLLGAVE
jgi:hypothetical protein